MAVLDAATGKLLWSKDLTGFEAAQIEVPPQMGAIAAFDVATGELKWRGGFPGPSGYSSPIVLNLAGVPQIVVVRRDSTVGMTMDGHELWTFSTQPTAAIAMPVQLSSDTIFISSSDDHFGGKALRVSHGADGSWSVEEAWAERLWCGPTARATAKWAG